MASDLKPSNTDDRVTLLRHGLRVGKRVVPLLSGSVHYFRMARASWAPALRELAAMGATFVDTYVPWSIHEKSRGDYDFGDIEPRLDVVAFIEEARRAGLYVIIRPGPHINAELTYFGIPERVIWDPDCQARSPGGSPVVLPILPLCFPVPSYASRAFYNEATLWLSAVAQRLAPSVYPNGPVVLAQVDNEGALYFRDGVYDQDHHPDALDQYRRFLRRKYKTLAALRGAYDNEDLTFDDIVPKARLDAQTADGLAPHLDWAEFQEALIESALYRFASVLRRGGLDGIPFFHNLPPGDAATPLDPLRLERVTDFVALDYYLRSTPESQREILRRTTEIAVRCDARHVPAFAAEVAAGFPPYFPALTEEDNAFVALCAVAYGIRALNIYMAVTRDRWIGGPIDARGNRRQSAAFWQKLFEALERTRFAELHLRTSVNIVVPRVLRRLVRVTHAFGPWSAAAFELSGHGVRGGSLETDFGLGSPPAIEAARFMEELQDCLERHRLPHRFVPEDLLESALRAGSWTVVVCAGGLETKTVELMARALMGGHPLTIGPRLPERTENFRPGRARIVPPNNPSVDVHLPCDPAGIEHVVSGAAARLDLFRHVASPRSIIATLHDDDHGTPRVLFLINSSTVDHQTEVSVPGVSGARDALSGMVIERDGESFALRVPAHSVTMLELTCSPVKS